MARRDRARPGSRIPASRAGCSDARSGSAGPAGAGTTGPLTAADALPARGSIRPRLIETPADPGRSSHRGRDRAAPGRAHHRPGTQADRRACR
jgi:hypothetical protein